MKWDPTVFVPLRLISLSAMLSGKVARLVNGLLQTYFSRVSLFLITFSSYSFTECEVWGELHVSCYIAKSPCMCQSLRMVANA